MPAATQRALAVILWPLLATTLLCACPDSTAQSDAAVADATPGDSATIDSARDRPGVDAGLSDAAGQDQQSPDSVGPDSTRPDSIWHDSTTADSTTPDSTRHDSAAAADSSALPLDECSAMGPDWVFCSGFEEGNLDIWDDYDGNPSATNTLMADPGPRGLDNNNVMRLRVPAGRGGADLVKVLPGTYDRLYTRWYVQWEPGYDFDALNHGGGLHAGSRNYLGRSDYQPDGDDWFGAWLEPNPNNHRLNIYAYYRGMYMNCADPDGQCWGDQFPCTADEGEVFCEQAQHRETVLPPALQAGQWYCVEMYADAGTASTNGSVSDGVLDFWVDGQQIGPWDDLWLRTSNQVELNILWLSLFHHGNHSVEGLMLDNVVVSTSRVGCL